MTTINSSKATKHDVQSKELHIVLLFLSAYVPNAEALKNYANNGDKNPLCTCINTCAPVVQYAASRSEGENPDAVFVIATDLVSREVSKQVLEAVNKIAGWQSLEAGTTHMDIFKKECNLPDEVCKIIDYNEAENPELENFKVITEAAQKISEFIEGAAQGANPNINLYLDMAGGLRHTAIVSTALSNLLGYKHPNIKTHSLYSMLLGLCEQKTTTEFKKTECKADCQRRECAKHTILIDISQTQNVFNIIAGTEEFTRFGSVKTLRENAFPAGDDSTSELRSLLDTMGEFADALSICHTKRVLEIVKDSILKNALENFANSNNATNPSEQFFRQLLKEITEQYRELLESKYPEADIIRWCVKNDKLQQAMTFFVEWMPKYIVDFEILYPTKPKEESLKEEYLKNSSRLSSIEYYFIVEPSIKNIDKSYQVGVRQAFTKLGEDKSNLTNIPHEIRPYVNEVLRVAEEYKDNIQGYLEVAEPNRLETIFMKKVFSLLKTSNSIEAKKVFNKIANLNNDAKEIWDLLLPNAGTEIKNVFTTSESTIKEIFEKYNKLLAAGNILTHSNAPVVTILQGYHRIRTERNKTNHANNRDKVDISAIKQQLLAWLDNILIYAPAGAKQ